MRRLRVKLGAELMTVGVLTVSLLGSLPARAQSARDSTSHFSRNAIYVEALGPGVFYSINYERRITQGISLRGGFTAWSGLVGFPLMVNALLGQDGDYFEIGIGAVPCYTPTPLPSSFSYIKSGKGFMYGTATLGYRHQPYNGGFLFRIDFTPIFARLNTFMLWGGMSVGYAF